MLFSPPPEKFPSYSAGYRYQKASRTDNKFTPKNERQHHYLRVSPSFNLISTMYALNSASQGHTTSC